MNAKALIAFFPLVLAGCSGDDDPAKGSTGGAGGTGGAGAAGGTGGSASGSAGMGTGGSASGSAGTGGSSGGGMCVTGTIVADAVNNYTFSSDITLTPTKLKANEPGLTFDWSGLTTDFLGRATNPMTDIDSVLLVVFGLTLEQFEMHLNVDDDLLETFNQGAVQLLTDKALTSANLKSFGVPGQADTTWETSEEVKKTVAEILDPTINDPASSIIAVMPAKGVQLGSGSRMIQLFTVDAAETKTSIAFAPSTVNAPGTDGHTGGTKGPSMSVVYDVDLDKLVPVNVNAGDANLTVDWSKMTKNGLGRDWQSRSISKVTVGHYTQSLTELENGFLALDTSAQAMYTKFAPTDEPLSIADAKDANGNAFPGIDDTGTWILGVFCDAMYCGNPAPWFLTILKPCK